MFVCSSCNETHTDGPICSVCKQQYDFTCSGVTEAGYRRLGDRRSVWRCVRCKASPCASPIPVSPSPTQLDKMQDQLNSILHQLALLATVVEDIKSIKSDISDLKTSIEMAHDRTDKLASNVNTLTAKVMSVEKIAADIPSLQKEVTRLNNEINMRDQWARANNIEIKGLPQLKNENLLDLAIKVGSVIGQQIKKEDVNYIARVPTRYFTLVSAGATQNKPVPKFVPLQDKTINVKLPTVNTMYKEEYIRDNTLSVNNAIDVLESAVVQAAHSNEKNILVHFPAIAKKSLLRQLMNIAGINEETFLRSESQDKTLKDLDVDQTRLSALQRYLSDVYDITWKVEEIEAITIKMISELEKEIVRYDFEESNGLGSYFSSAVADELLSTTEMIFLPTLTTCSSMRDDEFDATETYLCIVPGVEGQHSRFRDMCERLKLPALVLQPGLTHPQETVAELASRYAQTVLKKTELKNKFYLLGYESGVLVALEMAAILEQNGLTGTVFCIGGSPTEILANFKQHLSEYKTKEELQVAVLKHMYTMMTNESTAQLGNIVTKNLSWSEKVNACLHTLLGKIPHPIQFAKELIEAAYARLAVMLQHTPKPKLLRSQVISVRPRYLTSVDSSLQDYSSKKVISYQLEAPLSCAPQDLMCAAIINRHLDDDILENFNSRSHCETYLLNANTFMTTEHDIE